MLESEAVLSDRAAGNFTFRLSHLGYSSRAAYNMTRVVIIGGSGHVGTYLVPLLVERGYHVINVSRGSAKPYRPHAAWKSVEQVTADRKAEDSAGTFANRIVSLKPDFVIDMIAFELDSVTHLVDALIGKVEHYIFCSSVWVYGHSTTIPSVESEPTYPIEDYGRKKKLIEEYLMGRAKLEGFPATSFRPGHIVGEGWIPVNPQGNLNLEVCSTIARGEELALPNLGLETLNHVHADDCARWVLCAIDNRTASIGECFNVVASQAISMRGYAEAMYRFFGQEPKLTFAPIKEWSKGLAEGDVSATESHVYHSPCASIEKSRTRLGYDPRYSSLEAIQESVRALIREGRVKGPDGEK